MERMQPSEEVWGDARGWGANPFGIEGITPGPEIACHVVSIEPGAVRGNHRHPDAAEWMIVFGAPCTLAAPGPHGEQAQIVRLEPGDRPVIVKFAQGEAHAIRGEGPGTTYLVAFNDASDFATERVDPLLEPTGEFAP